MKHYRCERYPGFRIGDKVHFDLGKFFTNDLSLQKLIEANDFFGIYIFPDEEDSAPVFDPSKSPVSHLGTVTTKPVVHDYTNVSDAGRSLPEPEPMAPSPEAAEAIRPVALSFKQLSKMTKAALVAEAEARGVALSGDETRPELMKKLKEK